MSRQRNSFNKTYFIHRRPSSFLWMRLFLSEQNSFHVVDEFHMLKWFLLAVKKMHFYERWIYLCEWISNRIANWYQNNLWIFSPQIKFSFVSGIIHFCFEYYSSRASFISICTIHSQSKVIFVRCGNKSFLSMSFVFHKKWMLFTIKSELIQSQIKCIFLSCAKMCEIFIKFKFFFIEIWTHTLSPVILLLTLFGIYFPYSKKNWPDSLEKRICNFSRSCGILKYSL